ncbi:MAG: HD domain-containing protein [Clostridia bacterium]|nr:HD domain-containing protein [Clostridia bacterium]
MVSEDIAIAERIARRVLESGGRTFYVGGYVRDLLMGKEIKDVDIEVHGLGAQKLREILGEMGRVLTIGESFGIFKLEEHDVDIALPRYEKATGRGHKDFEVFVDPFAGTYEASRRRDFTVNALMQDVLTGEIVDHFGGMADLKKGVLRHVNDESFPEDPLRVLRGAQFASRFGFSIAPETMELSRRISLDSLSRERVEGEMKKALLKSDSPSVFFNVLREMDQLDRWFPELRALIGVEQNSEFHGEGDVWNHTLLVLDMGVHFRDMLPNSYEFMLSCLCHDLGKAVATQTIDGKIHAYEHEVKGVPIAERLIKRLTGDKQVLRYVLNMVRLHMKPNTVSAYRSKIKVTNRMFDESVDPVGLICLATADGLGSISKYPFYSHEEFLYERLRVYKEYMSRPHVTGIDLINKGFVPGPEFSRMLEYSHKLRLAGIDKEEALKQTVRYGNQLLKKEGKEICYEDSTD